MRRQAAIDATVALGVLAATLAVLAAGGFGQPDPDARELDPLGAVVAAGTALPLLARRRAPLAAYAASTAAACALLALRYPVDMPIGPMVAIAAVAAAYGGDPRAVRRRAAIAAVAAFVPAAAGAYALGGAKPRLAPELLGVAAVAAGVWIAGDRTRLRRERIAELEQQARRRERESERERRLAASEERTRIARELHDSAGHAINVILVHAGAARLLSERDPERSRQAIAAVEDVARDTIGEIDRLVRALREDDGGDAPPADPALLGELVERHRAGGLRITGDVAAPSRPLPRSVAWAAYRILQEALTNAARHGRGEAEVLVRFGADAAEIAVTNPAPADGGAPAGGGHGIVGMRERATVLGGTLTAVREDGAFRVHARLPYSGS